LRERIDGDLPGALIVAWFPRSAAVWSDPETDQAMAHVIEVNRALRNLRAEKNVAAATRVDVILRAAQFKDALDATNAATSFTSRTNLRVVSLEAELPPGEFAFGRIADTEIALQLPKVESSAERARLEKELAEAEAHIGRLEAQLANEKFRAKAPPQVISGVQATVSETKSKAAGLRERLATL
jgi:valyl-tRNA synthetase